MNATDTKKDMTRSDLVQLGYKLHHSAWCQGYVSRKHPPVVGEYNGRFGKGYTVLYNNGVSTRYSIVEYWVKA